MAKENNTKKNKNIRKDIDVKEVNDTSKREKKETVTKVLSAVDDNRKVIITGIVCFLLATLLFRCILWPDRIATLEDGKQPVLTIGEKIITADDMYTYLKDYYDGEMALAVMLNKLDRIALDKLYPDDTESYDKAKKQVDDILNNKDYISYYGSEKNILFQMGAGTRQEAYEVYKTNIQKEKYFEEYVESLVKDSDIEKYYKNNVTGDIDSKHILVNVSSDSEDGLSDSDAKKMAEEIIKKLNKGTSWDDVIKEYKDNITDEELGYQAFNASLEESYLNEMKSLKVGTYSKKPVKTSYGYHIVYKIDEKEKPKLEDVKDAIIDAIAAQMKKDDKNLESKAYKALREKDGLTFSDTTYESKYNNYVKGN